MPDISRRRFITMAATISAALATLAVAAPERASGSVSAQAPAATASHRYPTGLL